VFLGLAARVSLLAAMARRQLSAAVASLHVFALCHRISPFAKKGCRPFTGSHHLFFVRIGGEANRMPKEYPERYQTMSDPSKKPDTARGKRRWWQFGLRGLLLWFCWWPWGCLLEG
jgi:hypothetical protein